jgi:exonuclease III
MSFFRVKIVKGRQYLYRQTSVREGKKVRSIMEYVGSLCGPETYGKTSPRNQDLGATRNPKRMDFNDEHRKGLFKNDKAAFERLQTFDAARVKDAKDSKAAWKEKNTSRSEKQARADAKQAADAKWKDTTEAVKEFKERMDARGEADTTTGGKTGGA